MDDLRFKLKMRKSSIKDTGVNAEKPSTVYSRKNHPQLSTLRDPSKEFLDVNYTKAEIQKYCNHLKLDGIWTTKDKLIEKLMQHYSRANTAVLPSHGSPSLNAREEVNEYDYLNEDMSSTNLLEKFKLFVRETKDNFYVINISLKEKEREIEELKTRAFLAEEKVQSLQEALLRSTERNDHHGQTSASDSKKTLLIGDACLREVKGSDLQKNVIVRTLPEANMDLLNSWITEQLSHPLQECIIYCGIQDLLDDSATLVNAMDELGKVVAKLKGENDDIDVKVCELVPTLKSDELADKVNLFNKKLSDWCNNNGVSFIKTDNYFRLGTGDIDINCYENNDNVAYDNLSRIGAIRLLDAISASSTRKFVRDDWMEARHISFWYMNDKVFSTSHNNIDNNYKVNLNVNDRLSSRYDRNGSHHYNYKNPNTFNNNNTHYDRGMGTQHGSYYNHQYHRRNPQTNHVINHTHRTRPQSHQHTGARFNPSNQYQPQGSGTNLRNFGCYNCGEFNHRFSECYFDHRIKCKICNEYGHKPRLCDRNT